MNRFYRIIQFLYGAARPLLGSYDVCIYPVTCSQYAGKAFQTKSWPLAFALTSLRLLSCNPLGGLIRAWWWKHSIKS
ncbi:membrane protein insertion efficiency factor YidD [Candidatus Dependentiae bacterium]|nr:membrane protein insertion efficiency factor YidD [Candidatus Dependentiae bacterium]